MIDGETEEWKAAFDRNPYKLALERELTEQIGMAMLTVLGASRNSTDPKCTRAAERYDVLLATLARMQQKEDDEIRSSNDGPSPTEPD